MTNETKQVHFNKAVSLFSSGHEEAAAIELRDLFKFIVKEAKIRDQWSYRWSISSYGLSLEAQSEKQNHEYRMGFYYGHFFIESFLYNPSLLKAMEPKYWDKLSELDLIKGFSFSENAVVSDKVNFDLKPSKSSVFNLIRNYVLLTEHEDHSGIIDIGSFEATWSINETNEFLENEAAKVLKGIHEMNYMMYRNEYIRNKSREKYR